MSTWEESIKDAHRQLAEVSNEPGRAEAPYLGFTPFDAKSTAGSLPQVRYVFVSAKMGPRTLSDLYGTSQLATVPWLMRVRCSVRATTVEQTMLEAMALQTMLRETETATDIGDVSWTNTTDFQVSIGAYTATFDFVVPLTMTEGWSWHRSVVLEDHQEDSYESVEDIPDKTMLSGSTPAV